MKTPRKISRRKFLYEANCAAVGSASLFSSLFSLRLTAAGVTGAPITGYKAMVCLFLSGGNDSFNMLVPRETDRYIEYEAIRGSRDSEGDGLALPKSELLPITSTGQYNDPDPDKKYEFGIHPNLPILKQLYDQGDAAFVSNVGTLVEQTTLSQYKNKSVSLPLGLFSHSDEQLHWQTSVPQIRGAGPKGWAGRMADCMSQANSMSNIAMNISLSGSNVLQSGHNTVPYITSINGSVQLADYETDPTTQMAVDSILSNEYRNLYQKTLSQTNRGSIDKAIEFQTAVDGVSLSQPFPNPATSTSNRLKSIAKVIAARNPLSMDRQIFFLNRGGWDMHKEVIDKHEDLFTELNDAIAAFWNQMVDLGLQNDVILFTVSDFGRTLTSNGLGSDHAWGGNHFVIGGGINGGKIYGQYPILASGGPNDVGRGRLLPTTSVDAYGAELASWFGVPSSELETVFPNSTNFFDPVSTPFPLGMLG